MAVLILGKIVRCSLGGVRRFGIFASGWGSRLNWTRENMNSSRDSGDGKLALKGLFECGERVDGGLSELNRTVSEKADIRSGKTESLDR
jgi:hypothetical protein